MNEEARVKLFLRHLSVWYNANAPQYIKDPELDQKLDDWADAIDEWAKELRSEKNGD